MRHTAWAVSVVLVGSLASLSACQPNIIEAQPGENTARSSTTATVATSNPSPSTDPAATTVLTTSPITTPHTLPTTAASTIPSGTDTLNEQSEVIRLDGLGVTFTKPAGFLDLTEAGNAEIEFSGERFGENRASILVDACPDCSLAFMGGIPGRKYSDIMVAGQSSVKIEYVQQGVTSWIVIVRLPGDDVLIGVQGTDLAPIWDPLIDSFKIN